MNIPKAIEILELNLKEAGKKMPPDVRDALNLSIEALEAFKKYRHSPNSWFVKELPGETKD